MKRKSVPKRLQAILWSADVNSLDLDRDKHYIIHQVLIYGTLKEIRWLFHTYSKSEVINVFLKRPAKLYPYKIYAFVKNYLLGLSHVILDSQDYVTSIFGPVRQRTTNRI